MILARIRKSLALLLCLSVAACGGSGSGSPSASADNGNATASSPALSQGTVTGFGSVIVDGERISDTSASVETQDASGLATKGQSTDVKLGQRVEVDRAGDGSALRIRVMPEMIGPVSAIDATAKTLTVNSDTVTTNTDPTAGPVTTFAGYTGFGDIKVNDRVEVHGFPVLGSGGTLSIRATRIELKPAGTAALVAGTVSNLTSTSFKLGGITVVINGSTQVVPSGGTLANGQRVAVLAPAGISGGSMTATQIRIRRMTSDSSTIRTAGFVTNFSASASTFTLGGLTVNAAAAKVQPASASIANNAYVQVTGSVDASGNTLTADSVVVFAAVTQPPVELHGTITDFVSASQFKVRGVLIDASSATFKNGSASSLGDNVAVEIHGSVTDNVVKASTVEIQQMSQQDVVDLVATVQSYNAATHQLSLTLRVGASVQVALADATTFAPSGKTVADLTAGTAVLVHATRSGNSLNASSVTVLGQTSITSAFLAGIVSDPQPASGTLQSFRIEGMTMLVGSATLPDGFGAGDRVIVQYAMTGGVYTALSIQMLVNH